MKGKKVLLTGVTGFLGSHTTIQLLEKSYEVVGTLRDINRAESIKSVIGKHTKNIQQLSFVEADLNNNEIWREIIKGVDYVMHIASPFPRVLPKDEADLIRPAKEGTLHILKAAAANGVKRVVLTSSTGAIVYGKSKDHRSGIYNEKDWTDVSNKKDSTPYFRSKTIAEKAAWEFITQDDSGLELATICPGAILGPVLEKDFGTSANIVIKMLDGSSPAIPKIGFPIVDVRSVADLHIKAIESDTAKNERFVAANGFLSFQEIAAILRKAYPNRRIPKALLPDFAVRLYSNLDATLKPILLELGVERKVDDSKARQLLNWQPKSLEEAVLSCAESVLANGIIK
ncbi:MAG: aldehyde reductase [Bacteroidota bacterium]